MSTIEEKWASCHWTDFSKIRCAFWKTRQCPNVASGTMSFTVLMDGEEGVKDLTTVIALCTVHHHKFARSTVKSNQEALADLIFREKEPKYAVILFDTMT